MLSTSLRYFLEVARCGSLGDASRHLRITVSAVSRQIAKLEDQVGTPLFERTVRGMTLTEAGMTLQDFAARSAAEAERVSLILRERANAAPPQRVRIACSDGLSHLLVEVTSDLQAARPGLEVILEIVPSEDVAGLVRDGAAELGLAFGGSPGVGVELCRCWLTEVRAIIRTGHKLAGFETLGLSDLLEHDLALPTGTSLGRLVDLFGLLRPGIGRSVLRTNTFSAILRRVAGSDAVGLVSAASLAGRLDAERFVSIRLRSLSLGPRSVGLYLRSGRPYSGATELLAQRLISALAVLDPASVGELGAVPSIVEPT